MFDDQLGWLHYHPFNHFQLPEIEHVYTTENQGSQGDSHVKVPFCDKSGNVKFTRPLYRLKWAGEVSMPRSDWDRIPRKYISQLLGVSDMNHLQHTSDTFDQLFNLYSKGSVDVDKIVELLNMPEESLDSKKISHDFDDMLKKLFDKTPEQPKSTFGKIQKSQTFGFMKQLGDLLEQNPSITREKALEEMAAAWGLEMELNPCLEDSDYRVIKDLNQWTTVTECLGKLPDILPDTLAYHLAVNRRNYYPEAATTYDAYPHSVAALDAEKLDLILGARFALDDQAIAALGYLKWMAEGHWNHPLLKGFDTMVREHLASLSIVCTQLYFWMLQDYLYDQGARYWVKEDWKQHWHQLAGYLFWLGRTGDARVTDHAGIEPSWQGAVEGFEKHFPEVIANIALWERDFSFGRELRRIDPEAESIRADNPPDEELPVVIPPLPECYGKEWKLTEDKCATCWKHFACKKIFEEVIDQTRIRKMPKCLKLARILHPALKTKEYDEAVKDLMNLSEDTLENMIKKLGS